jgi:hypothetical protein
MEPGKSWYVAYWRTNRNTGSYWIGSDQEHPCLSMRELSQDHNRILIPLKNALCSYLCGSSGNHFEKALSPDDMMTGGGYGKRNNEESM